MGVAFAVLKMFRFFKRSAPAPTKAAPKPTVRKPTATRSVADPALPEQPSLPEVVEGNEHTDWALWEDSVMAMDSQMQDLSPSVKIYERDKQTPSEFQDIDPFSRVGKKSA